MKNKNGFTLIEITVCLIITGILACVVTPLYLNYISEAQKQNAQNNLLIINNLQHNYYFSHEGYCTGTNCNNLSNINQNLNVNISDNVYSYSCNVGSGKNPFCCNATNNQTSLDYPSGCSINIPIIPIPKPVNCVSDWTICSKTCGGGTQSFEILTPASNGGTACSIPPNTVQSCNTQACVCIPNCAGKACMSPDGCGGEC